MTTTKPQTAAKHLTRIYLISRTDGTASAIVRASSQAAAVRHVTRSAYTVRVADQDDLVTAISAGLKVQEAGDE